MRLQEVIDAHLSELVDVLAIKATDAAILWHLSALATLKRLLTLLAALEPVLQPPPANRMNVVMKLRACESALFWTETVYLYKEDQQHDAAVRTMIEHLVCFVHDLFLNCVQKVHNPDVQYKAIN